MKTTHPVLRRGLFSAFAGTAAGGALVVGLSLTTGPSATAAPDPCAASEVAKTIGSVATSTSKYLEANPETNQALTTVAKQQAGPQSLVTLKSYFDANPEVAEDMQRLQQPLATLSGRCKLPITVPQLMGLMQAAQTPDAGLPGGLPNAQNVAVPGVVPPAQSAPAQSAPAQSVPAQSVPAQSAPTRSAPAQSAPARTGTGPAPGPSARTVR